MRRVAILASSVWLAVFVSIALFTVFWRAGYSRPHVFWGLLSLLLVLTPTIWLAVAVLWRCVRGPGRLRAIGWLLIGATPLVWAAAITAFLLSLRHGPYFVQPSYIPSGGDIVFLVTSSAFDIESRFRYSHWTHGQHVVLIDNADELSREKLVADMDEHIEKMAKLLGQPVPNMEFPWVRIANSLGPPHGVTWGVWAFCYYREKSDSLTEHDRHEVCARGHRGTERPGSRSPGGAGRGVGVISELGP